MVYVEREQMENKAQKISSSGWSYRGVILSYFRESHRAYKWAYSVRNVAEPEWAAKQQRHYEAFRYRARTKAEAIEHIDEMYEKGWLV